MKTLLYFEEYYGPVSEALDKREDLFIIKVRKNISYWKYFPNETAEQHWGSHNSRIYYFDPTNSFNYEIMAFKNWLEYHNFKPEYFLNDSEYFMELSNKIARELNLECLSEKQVEWVRDKYAMKERFNEIGLKTVQYAAVENLEDVKDFFAKSNNNPIVFKPRKGMNSKNVFILKSLDDIDSLNVEIKPNKYMVETYCADQEWSIESLVQDGTVLDSYVTYIPNRTLWAAMNNRLNCHMTVPIIPEYFNFIPKTFIQNIVDGMNLKNGTMTIEVFIDGEGNVMPSELGWRLPGCQATKNHSLSYGFDMPNTLIDIAIHKKVNLNYKDIIDSVGDLYLPNKSGLIVNITSIDELLNMDGVIDGEMFVKQGEYREKRRVGNDASGWVEVEGKDEFDVLSKMKKIYDKFIIETDEEIGEKKYVKKI